MDINEKDLEDLGATEGVIEKVKSNLSKKPPSVPIGQGGSLVSKFDTEVEYLKFINTPFGYNSALRRIVSLMSAKLKEMKLDEQFADHPLIEDIERHTDYCAIHRPDRSQIRDDVLLENDSLDEYTHRTLITRLVEERFWDEFNASLEFQGEQFETILLHFNQMSFQGESVLHVDFDASGTVKPKWSGQDYSVPQRLGRYSR